MKYLTQYLLVIFLIVTSCSEEKNGPDMILTNGNIVTVDDSKPNAEAIAINADTIVAVGTGTEIELLAGTNTKIIDLKGKSVYPGFIDSHSHFLGIGVAAQNLNLMNAKNWDEIIFQVADAAQKLQPGEWVIGRGWHQEKWDPVPDPNVEGYPIHKVLSEATPYNPVMLTHASGHALFANSKAMESAGVTNETVDPDGGKIVRDEEGNPIGVFEENAAFLIQNAYQKFNSTKTKEIREAEFKRTVELAEQEILSNGITSLHDAGESFNVIDKFKTLADNNELDVRLNVMLGESNKMLKAKINDYKLIGYGNNFLTVRSIKKYMDGALGSRGAWLLEPYADLENHVGQNVTTLKELKQTAKIAIENGFQLNTHAIGDRGNQETLNLYERTFNGYENSKDLRWRIEHSQHLADSDIPRFAKLGVIAAMQGVHCTSDAVFVYKRLGEDRAKEGAYVWRKLIDSGALICNGTDAPVEKVDPFMSFYASVSRKLNDGSTFFPDQNMTRMEALKSYTINGAYAAFEENLKGSLVKGKLADIVVLSNDLLTCSDEDILNTKVLYTIVGGKIKYQSSK